MPTPHSAWPHSQRRRPSPRPRTSSPVRPNARVQHRRRHPETLDADTGVPTPTIPAIPVARMRFAHNAPVEAGFGRADAGGGGGGAGAGADRRDVLSMSLAEILPGLRADDRGAVYAIVQVHLLYGFLAYSAGFRAAACCSDSCACMWSNGRV